MGRVTDVVDFKHIFKHLPDTNILMSSNLTIIEATNIYLKLMSKRREDIINHDLFEVFPESEESERATRVRYNIEKAALTGETQFFPTFRYDITNNAGIMRTQILEEQFHSYKGGRWF